MTDDAVARMRLSLERARFFFEQILLYFLLPIESHGTRQVQDDSSAREPDQKGEDAGGAQGHAKAARVFSDGS